MWGHCADCYGEEIGKLGERDGDEGTFEMDIDIRYCRDNCITIFSVEGRLFSLFFNCC